MQYRVTGTVLTITADETDQWSGSTYADRVADHPQAGPVLVCGSVMVAGKKQPLMIRLEGRAELRQAIERWRQAVKDARDREESERSERRDAVIAQCPEDCEPCEQDWANGDLMSAKYRTMDGVDVMDSDLIPQAGYGIWYVSKDRCQDARDRAVAAASRASAEAAEQEEKIERARRLAETSGEPQPVRSWTETRRVKESGEWGDYPFSVTEYVRSDGSRFTKSVNCY